MNPSRIHELNKLAGKFCGKDIKRQKSTFCQWLLYYRNEDEQGYYHVWTPATDHNQAAEVKAKLREKFIRYSMRMIFLCSGQIFHQWELEGLGGFTREAGDESELIALLLAVEALGKEDYRA